ncbi:TPA: helix-turn-helix domain-containing protein [Klebsiella aerogenes]|nr:helix-turn-helix domain-containing protein [Klebsiella aerogenes]
MNTKMQLDRVVDKPLLSSLKPVSDIKTLINVMQSGAEKRILMKGEVLRYCHEDTRLCFLLLQGSVALHRRGDGIIMNSESAPFILGVSNQLSADENLYVRALETSEIASVPLDRFNRLVAENNTWEPLARLLIYTASRVYEHCTLIAQMSAYDIIRFQLIELMQESEAIRGQTTAAAYIKSRTYLSRSGIMRILSELRAGGYITMERGVLAEIHHLPLKY